MNQKEYRLVTLTDRFHGKLLAKLTLCGPVLEILFILSGDLTQLKIPKSKKNSKRKWDLWEHTCFEIFIKNPKRDEYLEYNFSPAGDWNSFHLSKIRQNDGEINSVKNVVADTIIFNGHLKFRAKIDVTEQQMFAIEEFKNGTLKCGITAVLEFKNGKKDYWSLKKIDGEVDFHNEKGFLPLF